MAQLIATRKVTPEQVWEALERALWRLVNVAGLPRPLSNADVGGWNVDAMWGGGW